MDPTKPCDTAMTASAFRSLPSSTISVVTITIDRGAFKDRHPFCALAYNRFSQECIIVPTLVAWSENHRSQIPRVIALRTSSALACGVGTLLGGMSKVE